MQVSFDNSYTKLPDRFFARQQPAPVPDPSLIRVNAALARLLGIDSAWLESDEGVAVIAGNRTPDGADPIATVYAGHQFGSWNPQLGDGRAILLGEVIGSDGERYDIQLKGAGQTPYSRMGDGRAPLGPVLREYIVSEAMAALGVPTSRALAAVTTGEPVYREEPLPGAVLARVSKSHIRIGTVQYFASQGDVEGVRLLMAHVIDRHYPEARNEANPILEALEQVMAAQARLVASWQMLGFIHGVMNTDNMLLSGETIDYGPCAFMDTYNPESVFSSIDHGGRYSYRNQPGITNWNLACLAQSLIPVVHESEEEAVALIRPVLEKFPGFFLAANIDGLRRKLGLNTEDPDDESLAKDFLDLLESEGCDFTLAFRRLSELGGASSEDSPPVSVKPLFDFPPAFSGWLQRWRARCDRESFDDRQHSMLNTNPAKIPRNHLVEEAIRAAVDEQDLKPFHGLVDALADPYTLQENELTFARPPLEDQVVKQTFCGT
jgi:uncharacterized protein YdiU (UPF0061 family)